MLALWAEARALGAATGDDWEQDLAADRAVARAVNGLPRSCGFIDPQSHR